MSFSGRVVFLCLLFTGCNERLPQDQAVVIQSEDSANNRYCFGFKKLAWRGHSYILYRSGDHGDALLHDPDCSCKNKEPR